MAKDPVSENVNGVTQLISSRMNKVPQSPSDMPEGAEGSRIDAFELDMADQELLALARDLENRYEPYESKIRIRQDAQKTYYLGTQKVGTSVDVSEMPIASNMIFEAEETFLPAALSKNPEPVVYTDDTPEGNILAKDVKTMLQYHADTLVLRRKLNRVCRLWSVDFIGVMKHGWDDQVGDIKSEVRKGRNFIFDPEGYVDEYGDFVGNLGERITVTAARLVELFPKHKDVITILVDGRMGTNVTYTEWWSDDFCFYTFKNILLDKNKNPHFNYEGVVTEDVDEFGNVETVETPPVNHFGRPKKPYTFLSVFSFGDQPHDATGLIEQNIPNQNLVTRRTNQIDYNLSKANNSDVFSGDNFNEQTATQAANALKKGNPVIVPSGKPLSEAIARLQTPGLGAEYFNDLNMQKTALRSSFGTEGISSQPPDEDQTARGMILNTQADSSRIGGGIGEALEQFADNVFNYWTQLYCVYYDVPHFASVMGLMKATEYVTLQAAQIDRRVVVSVAPDSMKPKDEITQMNEAQALYDKGAIDPKTLLTVLNFPDPQQTAEQAVLWTVDKNMYMRLNFPELWAKIQQANSEDLMAAGANPAVLPPTEGMPPEAITEPEGDSLAADPASAALSNVPLPE